jgi:acetyl-CoA acetyltransferase
MVDVLVDNAGTATGICNPPVATLLHALKQRNKRYGRLQIMCEGGGTGNAAIIERL